VFRGRYSFKKMLWIWKMPEMTGSIYRKYFLEEKLAQVSIQVLPVAVEKRFRI
jgi:hypothetical protein